MLLHSLKDPVPSPPTPVLVPLPDLCIMVTVLGINLLGDWLRDVLDPRLRL